jgi:threonine/homoserine/homoserine lactone efflux protein
MELSIIGRGALLGLTVAAPVGPIGVLVIRRSLSYGALIGLSTGLGAAVADASYAVIAALGLSLGPSSILSSPLFRVASAVMLLFMAYSTLRARPPETSDERPKERPSHARAFGETIALTLANPATIASFAAASTALGVGTSATPLVAVTFALSVLAGSAAWWLSLSAGTSAMRGKLGLGPSAMKWIGRASGVMLIGFAIMAIVR